MNSLLKYCLRLGDNSLILSHRLSEYSSNGPYLEEDLAITNVALDHLGQAEAFFKYASEIDTSTKTVDDIAYRRPETEYFNVQLVELPNTDFAYIIARQFFIDTYNFYLYTALKDSTDDMIAALAEKSLKEVTYHLRRSSEWVIRLGDGTSESHERMQDAIDHLWMFTGELFEMEDSEKALLTEGIAADLTLVKQQWETKINDVLLRATLHVPDNGYMVTGSRKGNHTEHLGHMLTEMQYLQRAYPQATW